MIVKKYLKKIKLSISSTEYYVQILNKPFKNSFYFFIFSMFLLGISISTNTVLTKLPEIKDSSFIALDELNNNFDENLEIILADNKLELNQKYISINWPSILNYKLYELPAHIAVINNSNARPSESKLPEANNSLFYINKNNFYISDQQLERTKQLEKNQQREKKWTAYPLDMFLNQNISYSINKQNLPKIVSSSKNIINKSFVKIQIFTAIILITFFVISRIWFLFAESILVFFLFKIYSFNLSFKQITKLSMNIMIPAGIIDLFTKIFYPNLNFSMNSIAFWVILSFISFHLNKTNINKQKQIERK